MAEGRDLPVGRIRGLRACASARGTFGVLALDHRQNLRRELAAGRSRVGHLRRDGRVQAGGRPRARRCRDGGPARPGDRRGPGDRGRLAARPGAACSWPSRPPATRGRRRPRVSRVLDGWSVAQAKRMGASAAKLLVYYHPDAANAADQERLVADVAADCVAADLPLFVEPLSFSIDPAEARLRANASAGGRRDRPAADRARWGHPQGRVPLRPGVTDEGRWRDACAELDEASGLPWVVLSGGVDDAMFEAQVRVACGAGASGVLVGRSVWAEAATMRRPSAMRSCGRRVEPGSPGWSIWSTSSVAPGPSWSRAARPDARTRRRLVLRGYAG